VSKYVARSKSNFAAKWVQKSKILLGRKLSLDFIWWIALITIYIARSPLSNLSNANVGKKMTQRVYKPNSVLTQVM